MDLIIKHTRNIWETIGGHDQRVMSQFKVDSQSFEDQYQPVNIWKYDNEVDFNPETKQNDFSVKVWFDGKGGDKILYNFIKNHGN